MKNLFLTGVNHTHDPHIRAHYARFLQFFVNSDDDQPSIQQMEISIEASPFDFFLRTMFADILRRQVQKWKPPNKLDMEKVRTVALKALHEYALGQVIKSRNVT